MSTKTDVYVIYGISFDYDMFSAKYAESEDLSDSILDQINDKKNKSDNLIALFDGMSGEYAIVGEKLGVGLEEEGLSLTSIDPKKLNKNKLLKKLKKYLKMDEEDMKYFEPKIYALSHYH